MTSSSLDLSRLFAAAEAALILKQAELNAADPLNHNHGDHMVEVFQAAMQAAAAKGGALGPEAGGEGTSIYDYADSPEASTGDSGSSDAGITDAGITDAGNANAANADAGIADAMDYAAGLLRGLPENGSAQVYARGLAELAAQFRQRGLTLEDLAAVARQRLQKELTGVESPEARPGKTAETMKALLNALAAWEQAEARAAQGDSPVERTAKGALDMGYLFAVGMAYLQAKQKGGDGLDVLVDTVVASSPLAQAPYRAQSGRIALRAILEAMIG